ncbi:MAG: TetR/AcrR family transcriptional regulator [Planctomycetota bacterium]|nr:TetR/AcrR family transcriptional regulator [Planctomycetota bacterium]
MPRNGGPKPRTKASSAPSTRQRLIEVARALMQERGYNGFSYLDVAAKVGISHVAVHHHFKTKADLGAAAMGDYAKSFAEALTLAEQRHHDAPARIHAFVELFRRVLLVGDRICLCGMLASEYATLPKAVRVEVRAFFELAESWLARVLEEGRRKGEVRLEGDAASTAASLFAGLEGALIAARTFDDASRFQAASAWLVAGLIAGRHAGTASTSAAAPLPAT